MLPCGYKQKKLTRPWRHTYLNTFRFSDFVSEHRPNDDVSRPEEVKSGQSSQATECLVLTNGLCIPTDYNTWTAPSEQTCRKENQTMRKDVAYMLCSRWNSHRGDSSSQTLYQFNFERQRERERASESWQWVNNFLCKIKINFNKSTV